MNTYQLMEALWSHANTRHRYGGVRAIDDLPLQAVHRPQHVWIINTDVLGGSGEHWVMVYLPLERNQACEFYDSNGQAPTDYHPALERFMLRNAPDYVYSTQCWQSPGTEFCGHYCLYWAQYRCLGYTYSYLMEKHTENTHYNDKVVSSYVKGRFYNILSKHF